MTICDKGGRKMSQTPQDELDLGNARTMGIASLVLGIVALASCFTGIGAMVGIICGIIGWVLGAKARKRLPINESGMATAGWICSMISLAICLGFILIFFIFGLGLLGMAAIAI